MSQSTIGSTNLKIGHPPPPVKQVFSTMEFVGWYTIGVNPTKEDVEFHQQVYTVYAYHLAVGFSLCYIGVPRQ